jgi:hypothetical protein
LGRFHRNQRIGALQEKDPGLLGHVLPSPHRFNAIEPRILELLWLLGLPLRGYLPALRKKS